MALQALFGSKTSSPACFLQDTKVQGKYPSKSSGVALFNVTRTRPDCLVALCHVRALPLVVAPPLLRRCLNFGFAFCPRSCTYELAISLQQPVHPFGFSRPLDFALGLTLRPGCQRLVAVALSALPAGLMPAVPSARAGAALTGNDAPPGSCASTPEGSTSLASAFLVTPVGSRMPGPSWDTDTLPSVNKAPTASCRSSSSGFKGSGRRSSVALFGA